MKDIRKILFEITDNEEVLTKNLKLKEFLDSYTLIEFFAKLEESGMNIYPTRIGLNKLKTIEDLEKAIEEHCNGKNM